MNWKNHPVNKIHIELSTNCNAGCPLCLRYFHGADIVRPDLNLTSISLEQFKNYFPDDFLKGLNRILFCGTMGDPIMAKDCYEIINYVKDINPTCFQVLHTNGGVRSTDFWTKMGRIFTAPYMTVIFSIDGLEDTNHLYRRKVNWNKLMQNVTAFINAGGNAVWEYLIFEHNEHQIEQARQLAKEMKFSEFKTKRPTGFEHPFKPAYRPRMVFDNNGKEEYKLFPSTNAKYNDNETLQVIDDLPYGVDTALVEQAKKLKYFPILLEKVETFSDSSAEELGFYKEELDQRTIKCNSHEHDGNEIYVNAEGILFPCCFVGTRHDSSLVSFIDNQVKSKIKPYKDSLNLNLKNVDEIIQSGVLDEIFTNSWSKPSLKQGKLGICSETCGGNSWFNLLYTKQ